MSISTGPLARKPAPQSLLARGWFAACPSDIEGVYRIYAESFRSEAQGIVDAAPAEDC
jgi:phosphoglucomutase